MRMRKSGYRSGLPSSDTDVVDTTQGRSMGDSKGDRRCSESYTNSTEGLEFRDRDGGVHGKMSLFVPSP